MDKRPQVKLGNEEGVKPLKLCRRIYICNYLSLMQSNRVCTKNYLQVTPS